jgi:hypothetical protein
MTRPTVSEEFDDRDPALAASIAAAFNVLTTLTGIRARVATYMICEGDTRRVVTLDEFRLALITCKRLEVVRSQIDQSDIYLAQQ